MKLYEYIILAVGWVLWLWPFVRSFKRSSSMLAQDRRSLWGILLQLIGYDVIWQGHFWLHSPALWRVILSVILQALAILLSWTGVRALGQHFRLEAALRSDHKLVQSGPYRLVRHPIYTSMLCKLLGDGVMVATPVLLAIGVVIVLIGTEIRVRIEDRLLAAHFGPEFVAYKRAVRAYIPLLW